MKVLLIQKKKRKGFYEGFNSLKSCTQCTMFPLLQGLGEMIVLQSYPQISFLRRLIPRLEPMICCFWWKGTCHCSKAEPFRFQLSSQENFYFTEEYRKLHSFVCLVFRNRKKYSGQSIELWPYFVGVH